MQGKDYVLTSGMEDLCLWVGAPWSLLCDPRSSGAGHQVWGPVVAPVPRQCDVSLTQPRESTTLTTVGLGKHQGVSTAGAPYQHPQVPWLCLKAGTGGSWSQQCAHTYLQGPAAVAMEWQWPAADTHTQWQAGAGSKLLSPCRLRDSCRGP